MEAGGTPAGPEVIGLILPVALSMFLHEPEPLPLEGVWEGTLPPTLCISGLLSLSPWTWPPCLGLMALGVPEPLGKDKKERKPEKLKGYICSALARILACWSGTQMISTSSVGI